MNNVFLFNTDLLKLMGTPASIYTSCIHQIG